MNLRLPRNVTLTLLSLLLLTACNNRPDRFVGRGFYYWKTNVNLSDYENRYMDSLKTDRFYLRFFDVDVEGKKVLPKAIINLGKGLPEKPVVPVVFITPAGLNAMSWKELAFYARNMAALIEGKAKEAGIVPSEIQIDCDWTQTNKELYFELLNKLRQQAYFKGKILSVTIRLHQVKYLAAAGIPPADKGLLMVYNIDNLRNVKVENSILNTQSAKSYLETVGSYPLPLDIALPIFQWTLLFEAEQLKGILRDVNGADLQNDPQIEKSGTYTYKVEATHLLKGYTLKKGQVLRLEESHIGRIKEISKYLAQRIKGDSLNLLLYHCDSLNFKNYKTNELEKVFSSFD
ncbi:MAG: hypothetical protein EOP54_13205 [Sphingobacteriales bacterium]|nr:MAG: hypothetical protein EOP54_13205 [Sphingobacteriales bacterium]